MDYTGVFWGIEKRAGPIAGFRDAGVRLETLNPKPFGSISSGFIVRVLRFRLGQLPTQ